MATYIRRVKNVCSISNKIIHRQNVLIVNLRGHHSLSSYYKHIAACQQCASPYTLSHRHLSHHNSLRQQRNLNSTFHTNRLLSSQLVAPVFLTHRRHESTNTEFASGTTLQEHVSSGYIPEPPPVPVQVPGVEDSVDVFTEPVLNALGEMPLAELGLATWYPSGIIQWAVEAIHVSVGLPWWGSIVIGTIILRICMFPLVIVAQRNTIQMANHMPTIQRLQEKFTAARMSANPMTAARAGQDLQDYMTRNKVNVFKNMLVPMAQAPVFISTFVGLRQMANLPVESLTSGGMLWFVDLTLTDPTYIMPIMTSLTLLVTMEVGADGVQTQNMSHAMKWGMRAIPLVMFPFIINFPAVMLCYWFTSNTFSLIQVMCLKIPVVREYFNIPERVNHPKEKAKKKKVPTATLR